MYRITYVGHDTVTRELVNYDDAVELYLSMYATLTGDDTYQGFPSEAGFPAEGYSEVGHDDGMRWELAIERVPASLTISWNGQTLRFVQAHEHEWQQVSDYRDRAGRYVGTSGFHYGFSDDHPVVRASSAAIARAVWRELGKSHCERCKGNGEVVPTSYTLPSGETVCDTHYEIYASEPRTTRAASFFEQARAAREDVAAGAYPSLSPAPTVIAPYHDNGTLIGKLPARIIGQVSPRPRAYLVEFLHNGEQRGAFPRGLVLA